MLNNLFTKNDNALIDENEYPSINEWVGEKTAENPLFIDVYQTINKIIVKVDMAGVKPEDLKVSLHNDLLTIKCQKRDSQEIAEEDYFYKECAVGFFSRSIILPAEVDNHQVEANLENGVLTITLYKDTSSEIKIKNH